MIIVDVFVPALGKVYDIQTDEKMNAGELKVQLLQLLHRKSGEEEQENSDYSLFLFRQSTRLKENSSLYSQGVRDGNRLLLV